MSRFFFVYFTIIGVKKIFRYIEDFVISRFYCISFCFWLALLGGKK